jgi:hypothetical protein
MSADQGQPAKRQRVGTRPSALRQLRPARAGIAALGTIAEGADINNLPTHSTEVTSLQVHVQATSFQEASQPNPAPSTDLAAQAHSSPVQQGACTTRNARLEAGQQAAAAPDMAPGRGLRGVIRKARGAAQPPPAAGVMVPEWETAGCRSLLVPMPSHTAHRIQSLRLELNGVLLPAECSQSLSLQYRPQQQALAIAQPRNSLPLLAGARLLPSKLLVGEGATCLMIRASWPLATPAEGKPVSQALGRNVVLCHGMMVCGTCNERHCKLIPDSVCTHLLMDVHPCVCRAASRYSGMGADWSRLGVMHRSIILKLGVTFTSAFHHWSPCS